MNRIDKLKKGFLKALGAASVMLLGSLVVPVHWALLLLWPLLIMFAYISYFKKHTDAAHRDQFADSLYYLGFLLTIFSLLVSLVPYLFQGEEMSATSLLGKFGVALSTTLIGLTGRIYFTSFEVSEEDYPEFVRGEVENSLNELRTELSHSAEVVKKFNKEVETSLDGLKDSLKSAAESIHDFSQEITRDAMDEARSKLSDAVDESAEKLSRAVEESAGKLSGAMEGAVGTMYETVSESSRQLNEAVANSAEMVTESIKKSSENLQTASDEFAEKLIKVEVDPSLPRDMLKQSFAGLTSQLDMLGEEVGRAKNALSEGAGEISESLSELSGIGSRIKDLADSAESLSDLEKGLTGFATRLSEIESSVQGFGEKAGDVNGVLSGLLEGMRETSNALETELKDIRELRAAMQEELKNVNDVTEAYWKNAMEGSRFLIEELKNGKTPKS